MFSRSNLLLVLLILLSVSVYFLYLKNLYPPYLTFSDSAKFADIAKNLLLNNSVGANFAPFHQEFFAFKGLLPISSPLLFPTIIAIFFKIFGISDIVVLFSSGLFFILSVLMIYLLGKKIFSPLIGYFAGLAFIFEQSMLNYASIGAGEMIFIFEILLATYLFLLKKKIWDFFAFATLITLYFTRQSAIIYIFSLTLLFIFLNFKTKKSLLKAVFIMLGIYLFIEIILLKFHNGLIFYSPFLSFFSSSINFSPDTASTSFLRGGTIDKVFQFKPLISKIFYNLYNLYKLLPQIFNPYLFVFFLLSLLRKKENFQNEIFKIFVFIIFVITVITASATLPLYRYLHPLIPFIYLLAVENLFWLLKNLFQSEKKVMISGLILLLFFIGGQTIGKIFLDSRFLHNNKNSNKPPVYVLLAKNLIDTNSGSLIITNLDAWGTWYGDRKTIWFPINPDQLKGNVEKVDAIYLTSYKIDDSNYYMGDEWRQAFLNPENIENKFLKENFIFSKKYILNAEDNYERENATAVLFIKK